MADDGATVLQLQSAGDLFGRHSHRKAVFHLVAQVRLERQLEAFVPLPADLGDLVGAHWIISAGPAAGSARVALQLPAYRALGSAQYLAD